MSDDLIDRRMKMNPATRAPSSTDLALKAVKEGKNIAEYRTTKWYRLGEEIVEVVRKDLGGGVGNFAQRYPARIVSAVPKYARLFVRGAGAAAGLVRPPATREEKKEVGKAIHGKHFGEMG